MPKVQILFAKAKDPSSKDVLTCVREDGSRTWSRLHAAFPIHDMTHYAVESEMRAKDGFFGLIAQGWDIGDFGIPEKRARMPLEALWVEHVVGIVWREFVTREISDYANFAAAISATLTALRESIKQNSQRQGPRAEYSEQERSILEKGIPPESRTNIMRRMGELAATWAQTPPGSHVELTFIS